MPSNSSSPVKLFFPLSRETTTPSHGVRNPMNALKSSYPIRNMLSVKPSTLTRGNDQLPSCLQECPLALLLPQTPRCPVKRMTFFPFPPMEDQNQGTPQTAGRQPAGEPENGPDVSVEDNLDVVPPMSITLEKVPQLTDYLSGLPSYTNPLQHNQFYHPTDGFYLSASDVVIQKIFFDLSAVPFRRSTPNLLYPRAGPRSEIRFDPAEVRAAIVTCGGLCPGMNTVIRELVVGLWDLYGVREIFGIRAGYRGFYTWDPIKLTPKWVDHWHKSGGTILQTSRGGFDLKKIVDAIEARGFNQLYIIGGDGTMRGVVKIFEETQRRNLKIGVCGIPKTVDNDIGIIDRSFGFQTAVETAQAAINAAHVEAESAVNGIGFVKLMGRSTGHIALHATLSSREVDCCLIPENDFYLEGKGGLFEFLEQRLRENGHAVLVVAEGAGQNLIPRTESEKEQRDESGNPVLLDVGQWLKSELKNWWEREHADELFTVKYIDPTYMIRAVPANATDNLYCTLLAHSAIHGVMAGYTGFVPGPINGNYAYIPVEHVSEAKNVVDTKDHKWAWVRSVTNQPDFAMR